MTVRAMLITASSLVFRKAFIRFAAIPHRAFVQELRSDRKCRGSIHIFQVLVVKRPAHQLLDDIQHWSDEFRTRQDEFNDLFDYRIRMYEGQLYFVKDAISSGTDDFCQGVFHDSEHCKFSPSLELK